MEKPDFWTKIVDNSTFKVTDKLEVSLSTSVHWYSLRNSDGDDYGSPNTWISCWAKQIVSGERPYQKPTRGYLDTTSNEYVYKFGGPCFTQQNNVPMFDEDYGVWNLGMSVTAPIFNGGRLRSIKKIQEANYENSKQDLIRGILKAFSEIEQFLDQNRSLDIQIEALNGAVKQSRDAYELSKERYDKGVTTLESVLNSQRQYNSIRSQQLTIRRLSIENRLSLVLAMGGEIKS